MGDAGPLHKFPQFETDPDGVLPSVPGVFAPHRARAGTSADRRRERAGQRALPLRARRHGDAGVPRLGGRRRGMAVPHRLARRAQRRPEQDGAPHPQPLVRARRRDQRVRGVVEPPADLRLHPGRGRVLGHVLFDLVAASFHGDTSDVPPDSVRERVERQFLGTVWEDLDIWRYQEYVEHPALSKVDAKPYMALRKWAHAVLRGAGSRYESRPRRDRRARTHRDRHAGAARAPSSGRTPALPSSPRRRAARRCPTSNDCCPPRARPACRSCTAWCSGDRTGSAANHNATIFAMGGTAVDITPGSEGATLLPEFGPAPSDVVLRRWHGVGPDGRHRPRRDPAQPRRDDDRRRRRLGEHRDHQPRAWTP